MIQTDKKHIEPYIKLVESFTNDEIDGKQFEKSFLEMFKNDSSQFDEREYEVLNNLFYDVEDFCADSAIRDEEDLDEQQLKVKSSVHLTNLQAL